MISLLIILKLSKNFEIDNKYIKVAINLKDELKKYFYKITKEFDYDFAYKTNENIWSLEWVLHSYFELKKYFQLSVKALISIEMQEFLKKQNNIEIQRLLESGFRHIFMKRRECLKRIS